MLRSISLLSTGIGRGFGSAGLTYVSVSHTSQLLSGLISYYKFDENSGVSVGDSVGANTGTWNGTLGSQWTPGIINSGGNFNGTDNYVDMGNVFGFERTNPWSIPYWIKGVDNGGDYVVAGKIDTTGNGTGYDLHLNNFNVYIHLAGTGASISDLLQVRYDATSILNDAGAAWHQIIFTYDGSSSASGVGIYVDGVPRTPITDFNTLHTSITNSGAFRIGIPYTGVTPGVSIFLKAKLDEIPIYGRVLNASEALQLYNNRAGLQYPFS